jgi:hypothetical protein
MTDNGCPEQLNGRPVSIFQLLHLLYDELVVDVCQFGGLHVYGLHTVYILFTV